MKKFITSDQLKDIQYAIKQFSLQDCKTARLQLQGCVNERGSPGTPGWILF